MQSNQTRSPKSCFLQALKVGLSHQSGSHHPWRKRRKSVFQHKQTYKQTNIHTYIHTHTYIYIYIYIHTHIYICLILSSGPSQGPKVDPPSPGLRLPERSGRSARRRSSAASAASGSPGGPTRSPRVVDDTVDGSRYKKSPTILGSTSGPLILESPIWLMVEILHDSIYIYRVYTIPP